MQRLAKDDGRPKGGKGKSREARWKCPYRWTACSSQRLRVEASSKTEEWAERLRVGQEEAERSSVPWRRAGQTGRLRCVGDAGAGEHRRAPRL